MAEHEKPTIERDTDHHGVIGEQDHPPHHGMSAGQYIATRFSSLKPPMAKAPNPFKLLMMLNARQWAFFSVAFIAWVRDIPRIFCDNRRVLPLTLFADVGRF